MIGNPKVYHDVEIDPMTQDEFLAAKAQGESVATVPTTLSEPIVVADLPLPPELAREVEHFCRRNGYGGSDRAGAEVDFKLSHHYAGHFLIATASPRGLVIHAIDLENPEEVHAIHQRLRAQGYPQVYSLFPARLNDPDVQILI